MAVKLRETKYTEKPKNYIWSFTKTDLKTKLLTVLLQGRKIS